MPLVPGDKLGHYEVLSLLGQGGMGEVYRAKDQKLGRDVALKVLPEAFSHDPSRMARLEREAKILAALNHPHIATIYGVEDRALVMELVEGETLSARLRKGPLNAGAVLRFAGQIAEALTAAHGKGIIHRDLKPANIMVTRAGIKVLDFGLAKFTLNADANPSSAETLTMTQHIVGTLPYMAPEQLEGKDHGPQTDIFALGLVTYEMATGRRAFSGESQHAIMTEVLRCNIPAMDGVPAPLARAIRNCVKKDPEDRWQTAREFQIALGWTLGSTEDTAQATTEPVTARGRHWERFAWGAAVILLLGGMLTTRFSRVPADVTPVAFQVLPPAGGSFHAFPGAPEGGATLAISPDGRHLAFLATVEGETKVWLRSLDSVSARPLAGTEGASNFPFWSPDSRFIAFFASGKLKRIEVAGGPPQDISLVPGSAWSGAWGSRGAIVFSGQGSEIYRVSAEGGEIAPLTKMDVAKDKEHIFPRFLPDGQRFLYVATDKDLRNRVYVGSVDSGESQFLIEGNSLMEYAPPTYSLFLREGSLLAQRFNESDLSFEGDAVPIAERLPYNFPLGVAPFSVSTTGVLAYQSGGITSRLAWVNRSGREIGTLGQPANYGQQRLSPDGRKVAVRVIDSRTNVTDLHIFDVSRGTSTLFTATPTVEFGPVWAPDGRRIAFSSDRGAPPFLHWKVLESGGDGEALLPPTGAGVQAEDWSPDGRFLLYTVSDPATNADLWKLPMEGERKPTVFLNTRFNERDARFSPDGHWVAYVSDESGRSEVHVRPFPGPGEAQRISKAGGSLPRWKRDGTELFYVAANQLMVVSIKLGARLESGAAKVLFHGGSARIIDLDVSSDGQSFLMNSGVTGPENLPITVVVNWTAGLKQ